MPAPRTPRAKRRTSADLALRRCLDPRVQPLALSPAHYIQEVLRQVVGDRDERIGPAEALQVSDLPRRAPLGAL